MIHKYVFNLSQIFFNSSDYFRYYYTTTIHYHFIPYVSKTLRKKNVNRTKRHSEISKKKKMIRVKLMNGFNVDKANDANNQMEHM